ncbi:MAG: hypothetical protein M1838_003629 [Thelocarpon superellum]|nr:MAG: hypothetical protein M1838_003629 [Thelocarpon superellum]
MTSQPPISPVPALYSPRNSTHLRANPSTSPYGSPAPAPPPPPPKTSSQDTSRIQSPQTGPPPPPPPPHPASSSLSPLPVTSTSADGAPGTPQSWPDPPFHSSGNPPGQLGAPPGPDAATGSTHPASTPDPGPSYLPQILQSKSKADLADALSTPSLLQALSTAPSAVPASHTTTTSTNLASALAVNAALGAHLPPVHDGLERSRATTSTHLLQSHALAQAWRNKQAEMDKALAPFSPQALYQNLAQAVAEQESLCHALEESFLEGGGARAGVGVGLGSAPHGSAGTGMGMSERGEHSEAWQARDREVAEWVRRFRDARRVYYLRRERKDRWDEGRVGGWR